MKKILVVLLAVMLVSLSASAFAAQKMGKGAKEVAAYASISSTDSSPGGTSKDQTLALGFGYFLTDPISLGARIDEMMTKSSGFKMSTTFIEVEGKYHFYQKGQPAIPYAGLSVGAAMTEVAGDSSTGVLFQPKAGVKVFLTENVAANAELNYSIYESEFAGANVKNKTLKLQAGLSMFF